MQAVVLKNTYVKENDTIVTLLCPEGVFQIYGRGYKSLKSKYHILNNTFIETELNVTKKSKKFWKINECTISNLNYRTDYTYLEATTLHKIVKLILLCQLKYDETTYNFFIYTLEKIDEVNAGKLMNFWLIYVFKLSGYTLNLKCCYKCKSTTNLKTINFSELSLVCSNCYQDEQLIPVNVIKTLNKYYSMQIRELENIENSKLASRIIEVLVSDYLGIAIYSNKGE